MSRCRPSVRMDHEWLASLGLGGLSPTAASTLLAAAWDALERRVGGRIADRLSEEQLAEVNRLIEAGHDEAALAWLDRMVPEHRSIVEETYGLLTKELREAAARGAPDRPGGGNREEEIQKEGNREERKERKEKRRKGR